MTLLEKFKKDNPTALLNCSDGTPDVCPGHMGYLKGESCIRDDSGGVDCGKCWRREYEDAKKISPSLKDSLVKAGEAAEKCGKHFVDTFKDCCKQNFEIIDTFKKGIESGDIKPHILDSGDRTEFETGAVRDMREGKGRCDLLPLDVIADYLKIQKETDNELDTLKRSNIHIIINYIRKFTESGNTVSLFWALTRFDRFCDAETLILEVAKHFEEGAKKYGDNNWQKGIPVRCYIDSAIRHYLKYLRGDKDEPHDRAFCWNILCAIWTCKHKPELNDYAKKESE